MSFIHYFLFAAVLACTAIIPSPISLAQQASPPAKEAVSVGALAWIEPKSRIIHLGPPNIFEGARVEELHVQEGETVKKGQILGFFSTYHQNQASFKAAEAQVRLAEASLKKVKSGAKKSDISSQQRIVEGLRALELSANQEFVRLDTLYKEQLAAKSQYDRSKAEKERLTAERKAAEETLKSIESVRPDDIQIAEARVQIAQADLQVARSNVELSMITAPIDGTILTIYTRNGEAVKNNTILDIANLDVLDAVAEIDENDILYVKEGQNAEIMIQGLNQPVKGKVRELGGQIKRNTVLDTNPNQMLDTRVIEVRIELNDVHNSDLRRLINKRVRAKILP